MRNRSVVLAPFLIVFFCAPLWAGIEPANTAVIVNGSMPMSQAVGSYYCQKRGIPPQNLITVNASTQDTIYTTDYAALALQIQNALAAPPFNVTAQSWSTDPIQVLVTCYGIPSRILNSSDSNTVSVDSYLSLLFNNYATPDALYALRNPYQGCDEEFSTFRASSGNSVTANGQTYHLRYLVCRLDAYDDITVNVPGFGTMPADVKNLIDRGASSAGQSGEFYLDEPWHSDAGYGNNWYPVAQSSLQALLTPACVTRDGTASQTYLGESNVIGYASFGMHDLDILLDTDWARPHFAWKPGSIAIINESAGGQTIRVPTHAYSYFILNSADPNNPETQSLNQPTLRIQLTYSAGGVVKYFPNYRLAMLDYAGNQLASALFGSNGIAQIDLSSPDIPWPADHRTQVQVYYPDNDGGYHNSEPLFSSTLTFNPADLLWTQKSQGLGCYASVYLARECCSEYVRDGCSGVNAAVSEPGANFVDANITLPRYPKVIAGPNRLIWGRVLSHSKRCFSATR